MSNNQYDILENEVGEYDEHDDRTTDEDVDMEDASDRGSETPPAKKDEDQDDDDGEWRPVKGKKASKARTASEADLDESTTVKTKSQRFAYDAFADFVAKKNANKRATVADYDDSEDEPEDEPAAAGNKGGSGFMSDARRQTNNGAHAATNLGTTQAQAFLAQTGFPLPPDTSSKKTPASSQQNNNAGGSASSSSRPAASNSAGSANAPNKGKGHGGAAPPPPPPPPGPAAGAANTQHNPPPARSVGTPAPYPFKAHVGRRAAHEQQPRDAFGFSIWAREVQLSGLPSSKALTANLEPIQFHAFTNADPNTCVFVYYECAEHTEMPAAVARFSLENYGKGRFPDGPLLQIITSNPNPRIGKNFRSKTILIRGTPEQIKDIIDELVISTTLGCFIARPVNAGPPTLLCTWANLTFRADQADELLVLVIEASRSCKELRAALALDSNDLIPADVNHVDWFTDSLHAVPFVINEPGTQISAVWWHIHALVPTSDVEAHSRFRRVFAKNVSIVTAYDGYSSTPEKPFKCSICRSIEHPQGLCPLPKQPEWYGFVPRERGTVEPETVEDEDEPKLAEAEEPAPKEPGPSQLPKPTMPKNFGDKGGKGKGKGKGYGKK